ncbi:hypothetical protein AB1L30_24545 [Bremerella sp. JC817]|uniref:hypothetical protein n=1 Tax=Bremerella sp. JC817 TaxID=3231756 RepID=UPI003458E756
MNMLPKAPNREALFRAELPSPVAPVPEAAPNGFNPLLCIRLDAAEASAPRPELALLPVPDELDAPAPSVAAGNWAENMLLPGLVIEPPLLMFVPPVPKLVEGTWVVPELTDCP